MKKLLITSVSIILLTWMIACPAYAAYSSLKFDIDWEAQGYEKLYCTCYILTGTTASGGTTRKGICACNREHLGMIAEVYTRDGKFIGLYECTDVGGTEGLRRAKGIDIWQPSIEEAKEVMRLSGGKVYVRWIDGKG